MQIPCLSDSQYFKDANRKINEMLSSYIAQFKDIVEDYSMVKKIVLDFNYQIGRMKAFSFMSHVRKNINNPIQRYKEDTETIIPDVKIRIKEIREIMEDIDINLIKNFQFVIQRKRITS